MIRRLTVRLVVVAFAFAICTYARAQAKPDLVISELRVDEGSNGQVIGKVLLKVTNTCRGSESGQSYVIVTFKESDQPGAKSLYFVASRLGGLKGGEARAVQLDVVAAGRSVPLTSHVVAEVDPYKKVVEANEDNNWRTLNPARGYDGGPSSCLSR